MDVDIVGKQTLLTTPKQQIIDLNNKLLSNLKIKIAE
jgi:hypothetical protein